jgi:malonate transporter
MDTVVNVSLPVFGIVFAGFLAARWGVLPQAGIKTLNDYVYYFALPALLFASLARAPVSELTNWRFAAANLGGILISFGLSIMVARTIFARGMPTLAMHGMAASYGTTGYMGVPLLITAFGQQAAVPAALATLIHNIPVITLVILAMEASKTLGQEQVGAEQVGAQTTRNNPAPGVARTVTKAILLNPLTIAVAAGAAVAISKVNLPGPIAVFTDLLANAAGPTALFAVGLALVGRGRALREGAVRGSEVATLVALKIGLQPLVTLLLVFTLFPLEALWRTTTMVMAALPVGAGVYVFAQRYNELVEETSIAILLSMLVSVVTVSVVLATI